MIELLLSFLSDDLSSILFPAFAFLSGILLIVFMALHSKSKGKAVSAPWYICAFLLPVVTAIMYLFNSKKQKEQSETKNKKSVSYIFGVLFVLAYIATAVFGVYMAIDIADYKSFVEEMESEQQSEATPERLKFENEEGQYVYYDAKGNEYTQSLMVKLYSKSGTSFDYARFQDFDKDGNAIYKGYYLDGSGQKLDAEYCFVDEDGYLAYKKELKCEEENQDSLYYFDCPYTDDEGNRFYPATLASWNSEGKLILK